MALWIGTSGWVYPHFRGVLYPAGLPQRRWLEHYATEFPTVEVNGTFYRLPSREATAAWAAAVPPGFTFAAKMSRFLTHLKRLREPAEPVARYLDRLEPLGDALGPTLLQLPPDLRRDDALLDGFLAVWPADRPLAVEFRHDSWFHDDVAARLAEAGAAACLADRHSRPVTPLWRTTGWGFVRLHEGRSTPRPAYGRAALASWVERIAERWGPDEPVYVYFNNDPGGAAVRDARTFAHLAQRAGLAVTGPAGAPADATAPARRAS